MSSIHTMNSNYILLGASLDTGNLGVNALCASTVKNIYLADPHARVWLMEGVRNPTSQIVRIAGGSSVELGRVGVRCNKTVWRKNHLLVLLLMSIAGRCLPSSWRKRFWNTNPHIKTICSAKAIFDITGGDSFSDIYGIRRMIIGSLRKILILLLDKPLVLLPQTFGPFQSRLVRFLARWILRRSTDVYSRDREGLDQISRLIGSRSMRCKPQVCPDVAFTLDSIPPKTIDVQPEPLPPKGTKVVVGFNVSGLLWNGGYTRKNMFGLAIEYQQLIAELLNAILQKEHTSVLLVPHVFPDAAYAVESDPDACRAVYDQFKNRFPSRILLLEGKYDQSEIKWIIGQCDFFLGSRMHACIAALSQRIPAIGLAYSKKFSGVFESVGMGDLVVDLRNENVDQIKDRVIEYLNCRRSISDRLKGTIDRAEQQVVQTLIHATVQYSAEAAE